MDKEVKKTKRTFSKVYKKFATKADFLKSIDIDPKDVEPAERL